MPSSSNFYQVKDDLKTQLTSFENEFKFKEVLFFELKFDFSKKDEFAKFKIAALAVNLQNIPTFI